jgi:hypothetical protein
VLGGRSAFERDGRMRELINDHIKEASLRHTGPVIAQKTEQRSDTKPVEFANAPLSSHADPTPTASVNAETNGNATVGSSDPIQPLVVKTITYRMVTLQTAALGPMPAVIPVPTAPVPTAEALPRDGDYSAGPDQQSVECTVIEICNTSERLVVANPTSQ